MEMQAFFFKLILRRSLKQKPAKFLGVFIDNRLNWKIHLAYISGTIARGIRILIKAWGYFNNDCMKCLYYSFIYPYLMYCNHTWGNTYKTSLSKLQVLQNKAGRVKTGSNPRINTELLYNKSGLLNLNDINLYLVRLFMHKIHQGNLSDFFMSILFTTTISITTIQEFPLIYICQKCLHVSVRLGSDIRESFFGTKFWWQTLIATIQKHALKLCWKIQHKSICTDWAYGTFNVLIHH